MGAQRAPFPENSPLTLYLQSFFNLIKSLKRVTRTYIFLKLRDKYKMPKQGALEIIEVKKISISLQRVAKQEHATMCIKNITH